MPKAKQAKVSPKPERQVPVIKWSNHATKPYTGIIVEGWTAGEGYINQSMMIARNTKDYHSRDIEKAIRVLIASRNPNLVKLSIVCKHVLEERKSK